MRVVPPLPAAGLSQRDNRYRETDTIHVDAVWRDSAISRIAKE
jgi:hypothetical protein